ncbi:MAG: MFS transporter [bacterium]|nr:MFS transporter [bacterium]
MSESQNAHLQEAGSKKASIRAGYERSVSQNFRYNTGCLLGFEFVWGLGSAFAMFFTVVPAYMASIGSPKSVVGLVTSLLVTLSPLQMLGAHFFSRRSRKTLVALGYAVGVVPWLLYSGVLFALPGFVSESYLLPLFVLAMVWYAALLSVCDALYFALMTDSTPLRKRGSLYGYRMAILAVAILGAAPATRWLMNEWSEPQNYYLAFLIGGGLYLFSSLVLMLFREQRNPDVRVRKGTRREGSAVEFWLRARGLLRRLWREPNYRITMFFLVLAFAAIQMGPFVVTFATEKIQGAGSHVLGFTVIRLVAAAVLGHLSGKIADRFGYRTVGVIMGVCLAAAFVIVGIAAQVDQVGIGLVYVGFALHAGTTTLGMMLLTNLSVELIPREETGMLIAAGNLVMLPVILVVVPLCGWIVDLTGDYFSVFLIGAALAIICSLGFAFIVREPRKRRMYVVRTISRT